MRDRRNTNLSTSSTFSNDSSVADPSRPSLSEKPVSTASPTSSPLLEPSTKENHSRPNASRLFMILRWLGLVCTLLAVWYLFLADSLAPRDIYSTESSIPEPGDVALGELYPSDEPSVIELVNFRGRSRWTVSIPHDYSFPLRSKHARAICKRGQDLRDEFSQRSRIMKAQDWRRRGGYYSEDATFLDIHEAESVGVFSPPHREDDGEICDKTLTFAFDVDDESFGKSLLMLWLSYGLAKREGRAFFVDDTRWLYGRYTSFFAPPPQTACRPPPKHQIVPCPHNAKHLLVSSATVPWTFGPAFEGEFTQTWRSGMGRSQRIFDLLRTGFQDLFHLTGEHALYAASRGAKFREEANQHGSGVIGIHLRRGDLHPFEFQFHQDYLPLDRYGAAARKLLQASHHADPTGETPDSDHCPLLLATDDPEMFESDELQQSIAPFEIQRVQERIQLATKATLDLSSPTQAEEQAPDSIYRKYVAENSGWEGGFYRALFSALGRPSTSRPSMPSSDADDLFADQAVQMRELVGTAYLLDLAVLAASDGVVCASSSATCRLLAVMMGWDAVVDGRWVNVDDGREWSWDGRR